MSTSWVSLRPGTEFYDAETTRHKLAEFFGSEDSDSIAVDGETKSESTSSLPVAIIEMLDQPLAMEALGGMIFYLRSLNMDKDLLSQKSFNVYDPIKKGETMVLDGQSLSHLEVRDMDLWHLGRVDVDSLNYRS
jgi:DNA mismatch repair protein MSH6